jgi:hypothetical protein
LPNTVGATSIPFVFAVGTGSKMWETAALTTYLQLRACPLANESTLQPSSSVLVAMRALSRRRPVLPAVC